MSDIISAVLTTVIGNYMISCFVLGLIVASVQTARWKGQRTAAVISGLFLNAYLLYGIGVGLAINAVMHSVFGDFAAEQIGWAQSPFQLELALASAGIAVIAIMVHGRRSPVLSKAAVTIGVAIFGFGAAAGHVFQAAVNGDTAVDNGGLLLAGDVVLNLIGIAFVVWHAVAIGREGVVPTDATVDHAVPVR
ncbi:DUF6790 family protein [Microbacterium sp. Leaf151]|uniref:DUF6790 family protein n=1 Tax=Microbacterium sp. Leaf151 TaxID=1736276 RepID=UPI0006F8245F|nr:DUF6790 family protein [Microbacterium sp. Leaf151]KQR26274.1 hypothetical protein ASF76_03195 [Microbacterium sp. Leaf151]